MYEVSTTEGGGRRAEGDAHHPGIFGRSNSYSYFVFRSMLFLPVRLLSLSVSVSPCRVDLFFSRVPTRLTLCVCLRLGVAVHDASAKLPSGILNGNVNQLGDFHQCVSAASDDGAVQGQYCVAYLQLLLRQDPEQATHPVLAAIYDGVYSHHAFRSNFEDVSSCWAKPCRNDLVSSEIAPSTSERRRSGVRIGLPFRGHHYSSSW